ncbi:MAG: hypothetical protein PHY34_06390 [Patescibacteria group bacterium]|nr:hypothetical protein [Patescibacteria group bacterium]MDD5716072.1 hypothetical protein [Patescibacteria group bacterium]
MQIKKKKQNDLFVGVSSLITTCPLCGAAFYPEEVTIIGEEPRTQLLHATCNRCSSSIVILLLMNDTGVHSVGLACDLTETDVLRFKDADPISPDDILRLHCELAARCPISENLR